MTDAENPHLAWDYLPLFIAATVLFLLAWGYRQHRDETDEDGNVIKEGQGFIAAFWPYFSFIGCFTIFAFLLPVEIQNSVVQSFAVVFLLFLFVGIPIGCVCSWVREIQRKRQEEIEAEMEFDKRPVHGTAGIATADEQRRAGL